MHAGRCCGVARECKAGRNAERCADGEQRHVDVPSVVTLQLIVRGAAREHRRFADLEQRGREPCREAQRDHQKSRLVEERVKRGRFNRQNGDEPDRAARRPSDIDLAEAGRQQARAGRRSAASGGRDSFGDAPRSRLPMVDDASVSGHGHGCPPVVAAVHSATAALGLQRRAAGECGGLVR